MTEKNSSLAFVQDLLLGGFSGIIAKTACAPLERVKILLQVQGASAQGAKPYKGIMDAMALNFACKEKYQKLFVRPREEVGFGLWFAGFLAAGGAAGATALTVSYPLEYTYTRLAADVGGGHAHGAAPVAGAAAPVRQYTGIMDCVKKTIQSDGIRGVYRGYGPSVLGIIVYRAGYFGIFDWTKAYVLPSLGIGQGKDAHTFATIATKFGLALTIDIFSALCAYPLDTVRRNMMMMSGRSDKLYNNSFQCLSYLVKKDGVKGLYKGAYMNSIRAVGSALVLVLYDELKHVLIQDSKSSH